MGVLLLAFVPAALFFCVGIYLQPLDGDLTRIGSHAERDHGWNAPQTVFDQPQYTQGDYTRGHDMVVVGDSFAMAMPLHQWQNQVATATGLSIVTMNSYSTSVQEILQSSVFALHPPRYFVLTYTERHFPSQIGKDVQCDGFVPVLHTGTHVDGKPPAALPTIDHPRILHRQTHWSDWRDVKLAHAAKHVLYSVVRPVFGYEPTKALSIGLSRPDLFSNAKPSTTLVFRGDVEKVAQWREAGLDELSCRIEKLRQRVEANGYTRFILMVPPDKLTAYSAWTTRQDLNSLSQLAELSQRHPAVMPRLDLALITAIDQGHQDVYLPNNTHWGSNGHLVVAQELVDFMKLPPRP